MFFYNASFAVRLSVALMLSAVLVGLAYWLC